MTAKVVKDMDAAPRAPIISTQTFVKLGVYLVPLAPLFAQAAYLGNRTSFLPIILVGPIAFVAILFQRRAPKAAKILSYPHLLFWGFVNFIFGLIAWMVNPPFYMLAVACVIAAFVAIRKKRLSEWSLAIACLATFVYLGWQIRFLSWFAFAAAVILGLAGAFIIKLLSGRRAFAGISRASMALCIFCMMTHPHSFVFHRMVYPSLLPEVTAQPGVTAIYDYGDPVVKREIGPQVMAVSRVPGTERFLLTYNMPTQYISVFERGRLDEIQHLWVGNPTSDMALFDPDDPTNAYIGCHDRLLHISTNPLKLLREFKLEKSKKTNYVHLDRKRDRIFLSQDLGVALTMVDRKSFASAGAIKLDRGFLTLDLWVDSPGDKVVASGPDMIGKRVEVFDLETLKSMGKSTWPLDFSPSFIAVDSAGRRIYLCSGLYGKVRVLNLENAEVKDTLDFEVGLRNLNFDEKRNLLLVGNYFKGVLTAYDPVARCAIGKIFLGDRLRWTQVDPVSGKYYAASSVGGFEIDPDKAFAVGPEP